MEQATATIALLDDLKARIGRLGQLVKAVDRAVIPFGIGAIDDRLPNGGLALGALHEVSGGGPDVEHGAAAALLIAGGLARHPGQVLWVAERGDLFAPALDAVGLSPDRVIYAEAGEAKFVLMAMEEGLRHAGLAGVVGELSGRLTLIASRRLQLAGCDQRPG
jgi:protein ImuA